MENTKFTHQVNEEQLGKIKDFIKSSKIKINSKVTPLRNSKTRKNIIVEFSENVNVGKTCTGEDFLKEIKKYRIFTDTLNLY